MGFDPFQKSDLHDKLTWKLKSFENMLEIEQMNQNMIIQFSNI